MTTLNTTSALAPELATASTSAPSTSATPIADVFADLDAAPDAQPGAAPVQSSSADEVIFTNPVFVPLPDLAANATFGQTACTTQAEIKVYEQPAESSTVLATLQGGVAVTRYSEAQAWSLIMFGDEKLMGWVATAGLKVS